ncbi:TARB1 methyltransferase, partial [Neodrepanis coruscans]|nr:TARB1 methyltransferase [Neodrepanis coruscans]
IGLHSAEIDSQMEWTDVQKKIIPWKNSTPSLDLEMAFQDRAAKLGKSSSGLIVVASLIDKPTNLGGLCRTSEIFGASALVVGSLHYIQDKQFQHLSVSAEQWLPLVEVKPCQLVDYLQQKKTEGYTIIGVEQTAKSFDLTEYCFPEKSLLLLGNEHEGIPPNLIHHLDVCVEIPQQGIIRSLNVHVSGALLIWEYTRQQVIKQKQQK